MNKTTFRFLFVAVPFLACSIIPTTVFGILFGQWGSNLIWGSYFGIGWCLAAFSSGGLIHDRIATDVGFIWGWSALIPLYFFAGWLWERSSERRRKTALWVLAISVLPIAPAKAMMGLDQLGVHLPDYTLHLAESY